MPPFPFGGAEGETESGANNWDGGGTQDFPHEFILLHCEKGTIGIGEKEGGYDIGGTYNASPGRDGDRTLGGAPRYRSQFNAFRTITSFGTF